MNLIFLGPPGAGKGTLARMLQQREGIPQIATGDILRTAIAAGTPLGQEANRFVQAGDLVPDAVMIGIVAERLQQEDAATGFALDGFPRTIAQAEALEAVLAGLSRGLDRVVYFEATETTLVRRLSGRQLCRASGHIYNAATNPPAAYSIISTQPLTVQFIPPPSAVGSVEIVGVYAGATLDISTGVVLGVPDNFACSARKGKRRTRPEPPTASVAGSMASSWPAFSARSCSSASRASQFRPKPCRRSMLSMRVGRMRPPRSRRSAL